MPSLYNCMQRLYLREARAAAIDHFKSRSVNCRPNKNLNDFKCLSSMVTHRQQYCMAPVNQNWAIMYIITCKNGVINEICTTWPIYEIFRSLYEMVYSYKASVQEESDLKLSLKHFCPWIEVINSMRSTRRDFYSSHCSF